MSTFDMQAGGDNGTDSDTTIDALGPFDRSKKAVLRVTANTGTPQQQIPNFDLVAITAQGSVNSPGIVSCGGPGVTPFNPPPGAPGIVGLAGSLAERMQDHLSGGDNVGVIGFGGDPTQEPIPVDLDSGAGVKGLSKSNWGVLGWSRFDFGVQGISGRGAEPVRSFGLRAGVFGIGTEAPSDSLFKVLPVGVVGNGSTDDNDSFTIGTAGIASGASVGRNNSVGVFGAFAGAGAGIGVFATAQQNPPGPTEVGESVGLIADGQGGPAAKFFGDVTIVGNLVVTGAKAAGVLHPDGSHRMLCCVESPESWFEDFGEATLHHGTARVQLDVDFVAVVDLELGYHVFLSPYGESNGLHVSQRAREEFTVKENNAGKSNAGFSYRIVARRKDVPHERLKRVRVTEKPAIPTEILQARRGS